ncbi:MAG TPA: hypothetical protein VJ842_18785 [Pyrinomonadaceae bacterium]|nr:hypothetical protein [Pyrinomonadaceae bacterium]
MATTRLAARRQYKRNSGERQIFDARLFTRTANGRDNAGNARKSKVGAGGTGRAQN